MVQVDVHFINAINNIWDNAKTYSEQPEITLKVTRNKTVVLFRRQWPRDDHRAAGADV